MSDIKELNKEKVERFLQRHGKRGEMILSVAGRLQQFNQAVNTPIGQQLLTDLMVMMEDRMEKIIEQTATPREITEYKVCKELAEKWADKIKQYGKTVDAIKNS